jgi:hypothetical protein
MPLLTQNSELRPHGIFNFTIPAWYVRLDDGSMFKTCPNAGACAQVCYARNGTYLFSNVLAAHTRNLRMIIDTPDEWQQAITNELQQRRFRPTNKPRDTIEGLNVDELDTWLSDWWHRGGKAVRIHDSGDFFGEWYLHRWFDIADAIPDVLFYAYTKEVAMLRKQQHVPINFRFVFSTGGLQDDLIGDDRHADVFPDDAAIDAAGYRSQDANDLLCVLMSTNKIGIPANNIPKFNKAMNGRRFSELRRNVRVVELTSTTTTPVP